MTEVHRNQSIKLDVHAHLVPVVPERFADLANVSWDPGIKTMMLDGEAIGTPPLFRAGELIKWMDKNNVRNAWISIPPPAYRSHLDKATSRSWVHYVNDGLAQICHDSGGRLFPLFHLPVEHPDLAAEVAAEGGRKFSMSAGAGPQVCLSDAVYESLWHHLDAQSAFLFIHPGSTCDPRLDRFFLRNLVGNPVETGIAASHLLFASVLERYPHITVCLAHGGGILPTVAGRIGHGYATGAIKGAELQQDPADGMRRFCADCISHEPSLLRLAEETFGRDHLYFGSDWPFPMGLLYPHDQLASLDATLRRHLFETNPTTLLARLEAVHSNET